MGMIAKTAMRMAGATERPPGQVTGADYPLEEARAPVGQAVQAVLLGKASPKDALNQAAQQVTGVLAAPG